MHIKNVTITSRPSISKFKDNKEYDEKFPEEIWNWLYKDWKNVRGRIFLPKPRCSHFAKIINKVNPYFCINVIRHNVPKITKHLFTCDFFCNVEGCKMRGIAVLFQSYNLHIEFFKTDIMHFKNERNSCQSRHIKHYERLKLGEKIAGLKTLKYTGMNNYKISMAPSLIVDI